ncbi:hypothetical protein BH24ACT13_BH24ACT13_07620 [soil metagenome]|jgi:uncharacterized membrane protein YeaQ/YmgE (transglycosylase-associated protein family)
MGIGDIIVLIIIGLIIGALARLVVPGRNPIGLLMTLLLGVVGAVVGGLIANAVGIDSAIVRFLIALAIAAVLVFALTGFQRGRTRT